jgi:hypothetical protein
MVGGGLDLAPSVSGGIVAGELVSIPMVTGLGIRRGEQHE